MGHQLGLVGQEVALLELAVDHHAAQCARDKLGGLRRPDRCAAGGRGAIGPIIGANGVLRATTSPMKVGLAVRPAIQLSKPCGRNGSSCEIALVAAVFPA